MSRAGDFGAVTTTVAARGDAERIAEALLSERLAACVQISGIDSSYVWRGAVTREAELLVTVKTRAALFAAVIARIRALHPYEVPQIVATPFSAGLADYLDWLEDNTGGG